MVWIPECCLAELTMYTAAFWIFMFVSRLMLLSALGKALSKDWEVNADSHPTHPSLLDHLLLSGKDKIIALGRMSSGGNVHPNPVVTQMVLVNLTTSQSKTKNVLPGKEVIGMS